MQQLIFKKEIEQSKMDALLYFLKSWNIEAELMTSPSIPKEEHDFSLAAGMWEDYNINADTLRTNALTRNR